MTPRRYRAAKACDTPRNRRLPGKAARGAPLPVFAATLRCSRRRPETNAAPALERIRSLLRELLLDEINRLVAVTGPDGKQTRYSYDAAGNRASVSYPNNVTTTYAYDSNNRLTQITHTRTSDNTVLASYQYTLNAAGQKTQIAESQNGTATRQLNYTYDGLNRLTLEQVQTPAGGVLTTTRTTTWTYDNTGNRLTQTVAVPALGSSPASTTKISYTYDSDDRLLTETVSASGTQTQATQYAYDANGNTTSKTVTVPDYGGTTSTTTTLYAYDSDNRLSQVSQGNTAQSAVPIVSFQYDANGNRVQAVGQDTIAYLIDSNQQYSQVIEENESGPASPASTLYVRGAGDLVSQNRGGTQSFFHGDALGGSRLLTNTAGQVTDSYAYQAFGLTDSQSGSTVNRHLFAGEYQDPTTGFYNLRARWMNPSIGRFTTRDKHEVCQFCVASLHRYTYAANDPVNDSDPSGQDDLASVSIAEEVNASLETGLLLVAA